MTDYEMKLRQMSGPELRAELKAQRRVRAFSHIAKAEAEMDRRSAAAASVRIPFAGRGCLSSPKA